MVFSQNILGDGTTFHRLPQWKSPDLASLCRWIAAGSKPEVVGRGTGNWYGNPGLSWDLRGL